MFSGKETMLPFYSTAQARAELRDLLQSPTLGPGGFMVVSSSGIPSGASPSINTPLRAGPVTVAPTLLQSALRNCAQAFFDPKTETTYLIADRINQGALRSVVLHELFHKHGKSSIPEHAWNHLVDQFQSWKTWDAGSNEYRIFQKAHARAAQDINTPHYIEELLAYGIEESVTLGVEPDAQAAEGSAEVWLHTITKTLQVACDKLTGKNQAPLTTKDLVNIGYALAQLDNPAHASEVRKVLAQLTSAPPPVDRAFQEWVSKTALPGKTTTFYARPSGSVHWASTTPLAGCTPSYIRLAHPLRANGKPFNIEGLIADAVDQARTNVQLIDYNRLNSALNRLRSSADMTDTDTVEGLWARLSSQQMNLAKECLAAAGFDGIHCADSGNVFVFDKSNIRSASIQDTTTDLRAVNFQRWFQGSKLQRDGKPITLYHGTSGAFTTFKENHATEKDAGWYGRGIYLTSDPATASAYAEYSRLQNGIQEGNPHVMPVYVCLKNPYHWPANRPIATTPEESARIRKNLAAAGYDGVIVPNSYADPQYADCYEVIAFEPSQIKSAIGNNGQYSPTESDIRFSLQAFNTVAVDSRGMPVMVFRGEHGSLSSDVRIQSRRGSISFGSKEAANTYAGTPNDYRLDADAIQPRIIPAYLEIKNPLINTPDDPFVDGSTLIEKLGFDTATRILRKFSDHIENTSNWMEEIDADGQFGSVDAFLDAHPERAGELYFEIYPLLDDADEVALLRQAGFDGAIHAGSGATAMEAEYKVFSEDQITYALSNTANQPRQTQSPAFKNWFKNSKIVDAQGEPQVVYHKTYTDFTAFDRSKIGLNDYGYAGHGFYFMPFPLQGLTYGDRTMPVYLSLQNPYIRTDDNWQSALDPYVWIPANIHRFNSRSEASAAWTQMMRDKGFDGFADKTGNGDGEIVAFDPTQIKSAIGNNGEFSQETADIRYSVQPQTKTPAFKQWFGDSKVVDEDGEPLVVYHGSGEGGFTTFDRRSWKTAYGHFFTPDREAADYYNHGKNPSTYAVFLSIKNPLRLDRIAEYESPIPKWLSAWINENFETPDQFEAWISRGDMYSDNLGRRQDDLMATAEENGHDGVMFYDAKGGGGTALSYVVFSPSQIKSATDNNGEFSSDNPDIRFSRVNEARNTPFDKWFSGSKITDAAGQPLRVFHGSPSSFNEFDPFSSMDGGFYFTADRRVALSFAKDEDGEVISLHEVYLNISNPKTIDLHGQDQPSQDQMREIFDLAKTEGFDGVVLLNVREFNGPGTQYVAFFPHQIKSATDNNGEFNPENLDIRFSRKDQTQATAFQKWFGDSKIVDSQGKPRVMYHGTSRDFSVFDRLKSLEWRQPSMDTVGLWFSSEPDKAGQYAGGDGFNIMPVYLSIRNPKLYRDFDQFLREMHEAEGRKFEDQNPKGLGSTEGIRAKLKAEGYDGIQFEQTDNASLYRDIENMQAAVERARNEEYSVKRADREPYTMKRVRLENTLRAMRDDLKNMGGSTEFDGHDVFVAFEPTQIKSAIGNDGHFDPESPDIRFSRKSDISEIGFYSALAREISALPLSTAPVQGWLDAIKGLINKGLVKADEVKWTGLHGWLAQQTGKVTKDSVTAYLAENCIEVKEVMLGDKRSRAIDREQAAARALAKLIDDSEDSCIRLAGMQGTVWSDEAIYYLQDGDTAPDRFPDHIREAAAEYLEVHRIAKVIENTPAKYEKYCITGEKSNYRELLLTLTSAAAEPPSIFDPDYRAKQEQFIADRDAIDAANYKSSHWDQANVLTHIRVNDRVDIDGKKVLFVEEIQSDWGQTGKKSGFLAPVDTTGFTAEKVERYGEMYWKIRKANGDHYYSVPATDLVDAEAAIAAAARKAPIHGGAVPTGPFVTKTDAWVNLALKRIVKIAADEGYDRVAFVNGSQSVDRYDLSKEIDRITWSPADKEHRTNFAIFINGEKSLGLLDSKTGVFPRFESGMWGGKRLDEVVGKELADKILSQQSGDISGCDLKIGGEGMKSFYDKIVSQAAKDIARKLGTEITTIHVDRTEFGNTGRPKDWNRADGAFSPQPGFDITPSVREKIANGMPLFSRAPNQESTPRLWTQINRALSSSLNQSTSPQGWIEYLNGLAQAGRIDQEALVQSGVMGWITEQDGSVTAADVLSMCRFEGHEEGHRQEYSLP